MTEKILTNKKNGMAVLILTTLLYLAAIGVLVFGIAKDNPVIGIPVLIWILIGWIPYLGLRILNPQEALVLTLFGKYAGTIKGDGFFFVNPFCRAVNPAAETKLNQSGDVQILITADIAPDHHIERIRLSLGFHSVHLAFVLLDSGLLL